MFPIENNLYSIDKKHWATLNLLKQSTEKVFSVFEHVPGQRFFLKVFKTLLESSLIMLTVTQHDVKHTKGLYKMLNVSIPKFCKMSQGNSCCPGTFIQKPLLEEPY